MAFIRGVGQQCMLLSWEGRIPTMGGNYVYHMGIWDIKIMLPLHHGYQYYIDSQSDFDTQESIPCFIKPKVYMCFLICQVAKIIGKN